jgi:hypothetical protein
MTPGELPGMWAAIGQRAEDAAVPAVNAMCELETRYLKDDLLVRYQHPPETWTTAPDDGPPARVTGELVDSVTPVFAAGQAGGIAEAATGPHTEYDAVQEYGAEIHAKPGHGPKGGVHTMHFRVDSVDYFPLSVYVPPRPYMHPAAETLAGSGAFTGVAAAAFEEAVWGQA